MRRGAGCAISVLGGAVIAESTSQVQQMRDLLECVWPQRWIPPSSRFGGRRGRGDERVLDRDGADLARTRRLGLARFETAVRKEIVRRGGRRPCLRIVRLLFAAGDPAGSWSTAWRAGTGAAAAADWRQTQRNWPTPKPG